MVNLKLGDYTREMLFKSVTQAAQKKKIAITLGVQWHIDVVFVLHLDYSSQKVSSDFFF